MTAYPVDTLLMLGPAPELVASDTGSPSEESGARRPASKALTGKELELGDIGSATGGAHARGRS